MSSTTFLMAMAIWLQVLVVAAMEIFILGKIPSINLIKEVCHHMEVIHIQPL